MGAASEAGGFDAARSAWPSSGNAAASSAASAVCIGAGSAEGLLPAWPGMLIGAAAAGPAPEDSSGSEAAQAAGGWELATGGLGRASRSRLLGFADSAAGVHGRRGGDGGGIGELVSRASALLSCRVQRHP